MGIRRQLKKLCKKNEIVTMRGAIDYFGRVRILKVGRKLVTFSHQYKDENEYQAMITTLRISEVKYLSCFDHLFDRSLPIQTTVEHPNLLENSVKES